MKTKVKVGIYPFSAESYSTYKYLEDFCPQYQVVALIAPRGLGLSGNIMLLIVLIE